MYIPEAFASADMSRARAIVDAHSFGTLIAARDEGRLEIAHIPFVLDPGEPFGRLRGHLARANPIAAELERPLAVTAVFLGPHAYVTPRWYEEPHNHVPTWNYAAVHVHGTARRMDDQREVLALLADLTAHFEGNVAERWSVDRLDPERLARLLQGITAFTLDVERVESKRKLSQNRSPADHAGVVAGLKGRATGDDERLAALMEE
jgi:transcriptional regulator